MSKRLILFLLTFITIPASFAITVALTSTRTIAPESFVKFSIQEGMLPVEGKIRGMKGIIDFDPEHLDQSRLDVTIETRTINTGNKTRDNHLKNEDFFDVKNYPQIRFESDNIAQDGAFYVAHGKLHMHGVTRERDIRFLVKDGLFNGNFTLDRSDYDIGGGVDMLIGDEVHVYITCITTALEAPTEK